MRILFIGDVVGRSGRDAIDLHVPALREKLSIDVVIANGENAAHGVGITPKICKQFYEAGVDVITTGNHVWRHDEIVPYIAKDPRLLRPVNYPDSSPGHGAYTHTLPDGRTILVVNVMGQLFMNPVMNCPFAHMDGILSGTSLKRNVQAIFVDVHCEATSEKMAMGHFLDGRVSAVVGTHTHVPTADTHIMRGGTAYQTDAGMTGDYDSVIGTEKSAVIRRFIKKINIKKVTADGEATLCGTFVETDDTTGLARRIEGVRVGGCLPESVPEIENF